jgi:type II secretory pathway pseudopilin PulG
MPQALRACGITVLELVVVVAIIGVILVVILTSQSSFNRVLLLTDTAYTVALSIRQTQSLGLSGHGYSGVQNVGYGIHINAAVPVTSYMQFADTDPSIANQPTLGYSYCPAHSNNNPNDPEARPGDCLYTSNDGQPIQTYRFLAGYTIGSVCGYDYTPGTGCSSNAYCSNGNLSTCQSQTLNNTVSAADIVFERPNTQTVMSTTLVGSPAPIIHVDWMCIQVTAPSSAGIGSRYIEVSKLGQVFVSSTCTP